MTLKELQQMIKEELDTYMNEETVSEENTQEAMAVNVDADDVDAGGDMKMDDSMEMLRKIYDMLKDKFEDMDDMDDDMDMDEDDMMESEETVAEEAVEEAMEKDEDDKMEEAMKDEKDEDMKEEVTPETTQLQERFQKLANIIK
jgi:hypothetical protein